MQKQQFVKHMHKKLITANVPISEKQLGTVMNTMLEEISNVMVDAKTLTFRSFGTFKIVHRPERKGRNPQTGESMQIKAHNVIKFVPSTTFKKLVK